MYTHTCTYTHTLMHAHTHTHRMSGVHIQNLLFSQLCTGKYCCDATHTIACTCTHTQRMHARMHARTHARTHTHTHFSPCASQLSLLRTILGDQELFIALEKLVGAWGWGYICLLYIFLLLVSCLLHTNTTCTHFCQAGWLMTGSLEWLVSSDGGSSVSMSSSST